MTVHFEKRTVPLHSTASGSLLEIDVWEYKHPNAERKSYLQSGLHGVELTGIPVLMRFMREIEERQPPELFICVPWSNPMGLDSQIMGQQTGYNNLHTNQQNCWNWNRITHLWDEGSVEGRWIRLLLELSKDADVVIDLHTAGIETIPHVYVHHSQKEHASFLGIPHLLVWETPSSSFSDTCYLRGQVALTLELSASRILSEASIGSSLEYLRCFFGFSKKEHTSCVWKLEQLRKWYAPQGGVVNWHKQAGDEVHRGDLLLTLFTRQEELLLESPFDGLLLLKNSIHAPHQHQELAKFLEFW